MERLINTIQHYAWGPVDGLSRFTGAVSSGKNEAELWMGAHPSAPSKVMRDGALLSLRECIRNAPDLELGADVVAASGPELPFLAKILAAAKPLSLQVHPNALQARRGFEREECAGIPSTAPHRSYKDPNAKPEILCALQEFYALSGFRDPLQSARLFAELSMDGSMPFIQALHASDLHAAVRLLLLPSAESRAALEAFKYALSRPPTAALAQAQAQAFFLECAWLRKLAAFYPEDPGLVVAALLNLVVLKEGEALCLEPCQIHAYLSGVGVEVMGNSDNVLRAGLTPKHIDVQELLEVLDARASAPTVLAPPLRDGGRSYHAPMLPFALEIQKLSAGNAVDETAKGPEIWALLSGSARDPQGLVSCGTSWFVRNGAPVRIVADVDARLMRVSQRASHGYTHDE
jgi:mannose-6-phosphate isomerase